jgi:hypothetical protein
MIHAAYEDYDDDDMMRIMMIMDDKILMKMMIINDRDHNYEYHNSIFRGVEFLHQR